MVLTVTTFVMATSSSCAVDVIRTRRTSRLPIGTLAPGTVSIGPCVTTDSSGVRRSYCGASSASRMLPISVCSRVGISCRGIGPGTSPTIFFSSCKRSIIPLLNNLTVHSVGTSRTRALNCFSPGRRSGKDCLVRDSCSFMSRDGHVIYPAGSGQMLVLGTASRRKGMLPRFRGILSVSVGTTTRTTLKGALSRGLLSMIFSCRKGL